MTWAGRRQIAILSTVFIVGVSPFAYLIWKQLNKPPTCTDGKHNGTERGVDCGGVCKNFCPFEVTDPVVKWSRAFRVTDTVWSAVAYVENQNMNAAISAMPYEFKLYDAKRNLIATRRGVTYLNPNGVAAVFEGGIRVDGKIPVFTIFQFLKDPEWVPVGAVSSYPALLTKDQMITDDQERTRLNALVQNPSRLFALQNIDVVALLYDREGNALAASKTIVESIAKENSTPVVFTWPQSLKEKVARIELIPRYNLLDKTSITQ